MTSHSMPFDWVERHAAGAVRQGVPIETLLAQSHITPRHGDRRDVISPVQSLLLCMNTVLTLEDAAHGLARKGLGAAFPVIGLRMMLGSATLEGAIQVLSRLYGMASDAVHIRLETEEDAAILAVRMEADDDRDSVYLEENFLVWSFIQILHFLGRAPPVAQVTLRDPTHFNLGRPHWGMGGLVSYGAVTRFRFPRRLLAAPPAVRAGDNVMWECHRSWLALVVGQAEDAVAVDRYLNPDGFVRFNDLVRESGLSPNTLRGRLQTPDGAFRASRRRVLAEAAAQRLTASDDTVEAVAADLGYSDARAFRRFLKGATGLTPQQVRDGGTVGSSADDQAALAALRTLSGKLSV